MNFGFRVDADEFELKANFAPAQSGLDPTKLATGRKSSSCCANLAAHVSHLGRSSFRSPMRNYFKYFLTSSVVLFTAFSIVFCLNIFEKYLRLASVRYLSRRLPFFFYFYDSIRGLIGPFASLLDFIISLFRYLAFGRTRRD